MNKKIKLVIACTLMIGACTPDKNQEPLQTVRLSQKYDQMCTQKYQRFFVKGNTSEMRHGLLRVNSCLENAFLEESLKRLDGSDTIPRIQASFIRLREGYQAIYWLMGTEDKGCEGVCGTMTQLEHVAAYKALLLNMLDDLMTRGTQL